MRFSPSLSALGTAARRRCQPRAPRPPTHSGCSCCDDDGASGSSCARAFAHPRAINDAHSHQSVSMCSRICVGFAAIGPQERGPHRAHRPRPLRRPATDRAPPRPPPKHTYCTSPTISTAGITRTDYAYSRMRRPATSRVSPLTVAGTSCVTALDHPGLSRKGDPNIDSTCRKLQPSRSSRSEFPQDA
jgi:hypothetical protein